MKCQMTPIKVVAALIFGLAVFGYLSDAIDKAIARNTMSRTSTAYLQNHTPAAPPAMFNLSEMNQPESELMARLFQLMFILFFISPPIIAILLFMIWKELKKRNDLK